MKVVNNQEHPITEVAVSEQMKAHSSQKAQGGHLSTP